MDVLHIFLSPGHNYFGRHGHPPGDHPLLEVDAAECVAGHGLRGDRFHDGDPGHKGQITFFAQETLEDVCRHLGLPPCFPGLFRRNVITRGVDLNTWIGREFEIQGVHFAGSEECRPCYWMDRAVAPGAEVALRGRGGLRARILTDGWLRVTQPKSS